MREERERRTTLAVEDLRIRKQILIERITEAVEDGNISTLV
jgi:hypothetical protein